MCVHVCSSFLFCINALSRCVVFRQCICQDVPSFGSACVKICHLLAMHLSRCVIFGQGALCVCMCVFFIIYALNALSRCVVSNAPVKM